MAPNPKAEMAFSAMRDLGIPEETVRPVLRNLLKLYDKNWELIEEENYRALADAIFDYEETKAMEEKKKYENINRVEDKKKEAQMHDESENPLKRLRLRHREDQVSPSVGISDAVLGETSLVRSKIEEAAKTSELHLGDKRAKPVPVSSRRHLRVKGKEPVLSQTSPVQERAGASQLCLRERRSESNSITPPTHLRDKGKEPISPQIAPRETRSVSGRSSHVVYFKEPKVEPGTVLLPKRKVPSIHDDDSLINPKSEPFTDDLPQFEVPIAMIHPALPYPSCKEGSSIGNDSMRQADGMKSMASQNVDAEDKGDGVSDSACKTGTNYEIVHSSEAYANFEIASSPLGEVFFTSKRKGWGLRTLEDLPMGAFVCEYVGEILTNTELYERNIRSTGNEKHTYPVLLDADWGSERVLKDEEALCLDATIYGNVARFINHRCHDGNLIEIPVEVETPDHHYYHVAFFTTRKVDALEELTWDYCIDFDDHNHPVKAFRCCCGSKFCRDMKNSNS
ncbi:hypothetical protein HHK36_020442 [Tetracentron sinense]|uniref:SET domain-containing protein n=1 Tax=Tetracentron sinense TaxID=13715 RepID=A0A834YU21_TETSI|nr:hypothetical protein HHK36_020442 [Tetracentron sinense]